MNFIQILYQPDQHDRIFEYLKGKFAEGVSKVSVTSLIVDHLMRLDWEKMLDPTVLAQDLTDAFPDVVIETPSNTGIASTSRFFNKSQLW